MCCATAARTRRDGRNGRFAAKVATCSPCGRPARRDAAHLRSRHDPTPVPPAFAVLLAAALLSTACAPEDDDPTSTTPKASGSSSAASPTEDACAKESLETHTPGTLTITTDKPAYPPWFEDDDPANGKGYEGAVAAAVAEQLGFTPDEVTWTRTKFDAAIAPGPKDWDFDINQFSITEERKQAVDFSSPYYDVTPGGRDHRRVEGRQGDQPGRPQGAQDRRPGGHDVVRRHHLDDRPGPEAARSTTPTTTPSRRWRTGRSTRSSPTCRPRSTSPRPSCPTARSSGSCRAGAASRSSSGSSWTRAARSPRA